MRIIEENEKKEIIHICDKCGCKFAYTKEDTYSNPFGIVVECPSCHKEITIEKFKRMAQFPDSYYNFGGKNSVTIDNETIEKEVKKGIKYCLEHNEYQWFTAYGNIFVEINWLTGEDNSFEIIVAQNYYENNIEEEDAKKLIENFNY